MSENSGGTTFAKAALVWAGLSARLLGWRPPDFWQPTPAELATALAPPPGAGAAPLDRSEINRMMERDNERSS